MAARVRYRSGYSERVAYAAVNSTRPQQETSGHPLDLPVWLSREYEVSTASLSCPVVSPGSQSRQTADEQTTAERLQAFKEASGLTWDQVARLFGVSKRAVLLWKAGGTMSPRREERLADLAAQLAEFVGQDPLQTRARLLTVRDGVAPYQRWQEQGRRADSQRAWIDRQPEA